MNFDVFKYFFFIIFYLLVALSDSCLDTKLFIMGNINIYL